MIFGKSLKYDFNIKYRGELSLRLRVRPYMKEGCYQKVRAGAMIAELDSIREFPNRAWNIMHGWPSQTREEAR